jgi:hypothetical protein
LGRNPPAKFVDRLTVGHAALRIERAHHSKSSSEISASQMARQADLERAIAMDRDGKTDHASRPAIDVMAAADSQQVPATPLDQASEFAAGQ